MTDDQKIELLKSKFQQIIQASLKQDPKADTMFLSLFNAVKDNDALFQSLAADDIAIRQTQITDMQTAIADHEAKVAELQPVIDTPSKVK